MKALDEFKEEFAKSIYNRSPAECKKAGICIQCQRPALDHCYSDAGRKEFMISAMCEECFDALFDE
jgi:hypothetical protein